MLLPLEMIINIFKFEKIFITVRVCLQTKVSFSSKSFIKNGVLNFSGPSQQQFPLVGCVAVLCRRCTWHCVVEKVVECNTKKKNHSSPPSRFRGKCVWFYFSAIASVWVIFCNLLKYLIHLFLSFSSLPSTISLKGLYL